MWMLVPASDLHDLEDRTATGVKVRYLYCADCGRYSGGGVCRVCERGRGEFRPPVPPTVAARVKLEPFVAILCTRGQGCTVVSLPLATDAADAAEKRQEALEPVAAPARSLISATGAALGTPGPDGNTTKQEILL